MKNFNQRGGNRGGFKSGGKGFGRPAFGGKGGFDRGPVTMHQAVCDSCGNSCEVPFRPSGDKPVYCNNCFGGKKEGGNDRFPRKDFGRPAFGGKGGFDKKPTSLAGGNEDLKRQLELISSKLDKLVSSIDRLTEKKEEVISVDKKIEINEKKKSPIVKTVAKKVATKKSVAPAKKKAGTKKSKKAN